MYQVETEQFNGPLDLLLKLIQDKELNISQISLAKIADQYLNYLETHEGEIDPDGLADFLWIGSKLIYLKSRLLVPTVADDEEDEDLDDLAKQLKLYKEYIEASKDISNILKKQRICYLATHFEIIAGFYPPRNFSIKDLEKNFQQILLNIIPLNKLPQRTIRRIISLRQRISEIKDFIFSRPKTNFNSLLNDKQCSSEIIVTFLALLELSKQNSINLSQEELFAEIKITKA